MILEGYKLGAQGGSEVQIGGRTVHEIEVDFQSRCRHYRLDVDIVAILFKCCGKFFSCIECHTALTDHPVLRWAPGERQRKAILCGACGTSTSIALYMDSGDRCLECGFLFNPGCRLHHPLYFEQL